MSRRTRRSTGPPRCAECGAQFIWLRAPVTGNWRPFDPAPIDRRSSTQRVAYPVENNRAWMPRELIEDLMERRECSRDQATSEVDDMPWHTPHICTPPPVEHEPDRELEEASR